jgi:hypothetical protein
MRWDTRDTVGLRTPDTQCCPHQDIRIQDIVRGHVGTFALAQDTLESGAYPMEQQTWDIVQHT